MYFMDYVDEEKEYAKEKGIKQGFEQGTQETAVSNAKKMLEDGLSLDKTVLYSGLPLEKVQELAREVTVSVGK